MRWIRLLTLLWITSLTRPGWAEFSLIPLRDWTAQGGISSLTISPDGKRVTGINYGGSTTVFLLDLDADKTTMVAKWERDRRHLYGSWPIAVHWVANDLLAVDYSTRESVSIDLNGKHQVDLGERFVRRLVEKG